MRILTFSIALLIALLTVSGTPAQTSYLIYSTPTQVALTAAGAGTFILDDTTPGTPVPVKATTDQAWLTVTPATGTTFHATYKLAAKVAGLAAGVHSANVVITETGPNAGGFSDSNSPFNIPVTITIAGTKDVSLVINYNGTPQTYSIQPQNILEIQGNSSTGTPELQVCDIHGNCLHLAQ